MKKRIAMGLALCLLLGALSVIRTGERGYRAVMSSMDTGELYLGKGGEGADGRDKWNE